ncbi:hypothetical protein EYF80_049316 [Liparis tanakae]|uniref:Uncharacterized protein n=1 Tax=Liparis tanakae TaxID=230148 RepID=A0A4Z2FH22_9TELE|nr:hypothetical protein EYF80_049316 [Liparis tanakae]
MEKGNGKKGPQIPMKVMALGRAEHHSTTVPPKRLGFTVQINSLGIIPAWGRQELLLLPTEKTNENLIDHKELKRTGSVNLRVGTEQSLECSAADTQSSQQHTLGFTSAAHQNLNYNRNYSFDSTCVCSDSRVHLHLRFDQRLAGDCQEEID